MSIRFRHGLQISTVLVVALWCILQVPGDDATDENTDRKAAIELAERQLSRCAMRAEYDPEKKIERIDRALLLFGDAARNNSNGTLWAFGKTGRPAAFLELYQGATANAQWCHAVTLTGTRRVILQTPMAGEWRPDSIQVRPEPFVDAPAPGEKPELRLRQMKEFARRFTAHEFWDPDNSRFELRQLAQPVYRYNEAEAGLQDGAAFVFANGTNPEVVLLIEALGSQPATAKWHYSLARLGSAELHAELNGKEVWVRERTPGVVGSPNDPYWLFFGDSM